MLRVLGDAPITPLSPREGEGEEEMDLEEIECSQSRYAAKSVKEKLVITPDSISNGKAGLTHRNHKVTQDPIEEGNGTKKGPPREFQKRKRKLDHHNGSNKKRINNRRSRSYSSRRSHSSGSLSSGGNDDLEGHIVAKPGDKIKNRYEIIKQIGMGTFGKVFHCHDRKHKDMVAIKVVRRIERYVDSAKIEADILDDIYDRQSKQKANCCLKLYSHFELDKHYFLVTEKLGHSLYDVMKMNRYKGFPMRMIRNIARQLLQAMRFLKSMNLIHTDLKVENVLFVGDLSTRESDNETQNDVPINDDDNKDNGRNSFKESRTSSQAKYPESSTIKIIDFGGATYDDEKKSTIINTRQYRSPEVLLETKWSFPSDIWSVGCIIAEIYLGGLLFQTHNNLEHLALIERSCGLFPYRMLEVSPVSREYFDKRGKVRFYELHSDSQNHVRGMKRIQDVFAIDRKRGDRSGIADLVKELLEIDPSRRMTASEALKMSFLR